MNRYLLDTCFILGLYAHNQQALTVINGISFSLCAVSAVNRVELLGYHGISDDDDKELRHFLSLVTCLEINRAVQDKAIELRRRHKIKLADSLVLATALTYNLELLTLDKDLKNKFIQEKSR